MTDKLRVALERIIALDVPVNTVDVMDSTAREAVEIAKDALAQQDARQDVDWEKLYRLEAKKKEALAAKYERDIKPLTKVVPLTHAVQQDAQAEQEPVASPQRQIKRIHPLDVPLEVFLADLTTRPANVIRLEIRGLFDGEPLTVRHLCMFSRKEMKRWPQFGKKCLNEVEELLRARGLQLWENHDERSLRLLREHKEYFL